MSSLGRASLPYRLGAHAPALVLLASAAILGTALASQYLGGLAPCKLCLYQRWPYAATIALGLGAVAFARGGLAGRLIVALCGVAFLVGAGIAGYHAGVEYGWFPGPTSCSGAATEATTVEELRRQLMAAPIVRCDEVAWSLFGVSMAGYNFLVSLALAAFALFSAGVAMKERER